LVTLLLCLATSQQGNTWSSWNSYAAANPAIVGAYTKPAKPDGFNRWTDTTTTQGSYSTRVNQYRYTYSLALSGSVCNVYCGPRSFLTLDPYGNPVCQRDMSFWNNLSGYGTYCIPDVDKVCSGVPVDSIPTLASIGACNMNAVRSSSLHPSYSTYECCYNDRNKAFYVPNDLTKRIGSTTLFSLRNVENPVNS
jgi:hypothetical protein